MQSKLKNNNKPISQELKQILIVLLFFFILILSKSIYSFINKKPNKEGKLLPANYCEINNITNPVDCILARQMGTTSGSAAKSLIEAKPTPDFSQVTTTKVGMFSAPDDYGTSYYYRGVVDNNFVKLGKFYWRIVRITGDGNIKLTFQGRTPDATGDASGIGKGVFASDSTDKKYVGYVYDETVDSSIKTRIDTWYENNILNEGLSELLADTGFCGDRSERINGITSYFGSYDRLVQSKAPVLECPNKSDNYTVSSERGNGKLTYPITLLSADEVAMAGATTCKDNKNYYLYSNISEYTLSPYQSEPIYDEGNQFFVVSAGVNGSTFFNSTREYNARPSIHLRGDTIEVVAGTGTVDNPYILNDEPIYENLGDGILKIEGNSEDLNIAKMNISSKLKPDFSQQPTTKEGMFTAPDDYGTSYYYRGVVDNNFVKFGDFYWLVVRITGDDNIKLIYYGTDTTRPNHIYTGTFADTSANYEYVSFIGARQIMTDSNLKTFFDQWYKNNIFDKNLHYFISDTSFCEDKTYITNYDGTLHYGAYTRSYLGSDIDLRNTYTFVCPRKDDNYTVDDTLKGNGYLKYPIALLTADELFMAGGRANLSYFLTYYNEQNNFNQEWLMSSFTTENATTKRFVQVGNQNIIYGFNTSFTGQARPSIHLKRDKALILSGNGTKEMPYVIKTN